MQWSPDAPQLASLPPPPLESLAQTFVQPLQNACMRPCPMMQYAQSLRAYGAGVDLPGAPSGD
jgi:hypothetical protein